VIKFYPKSLFKNPRRTKFKPNYYNIRTIRTSVHKFNVKHDFSNMLYFPLKTMTSH